MWWFYISLQKAYLKAAAASVGLSGKTPQVRESVQAEGVLCGCSEVLCRENISFLSFKKAVC